MKLLKKFFVLFLMYFSCQTVLAGAGFLDGVTNKLACVALDSLVAGELIDALEKEPKQSRAIIYKYLPPSLPEKDREFSIRLYEEMLSDIKGHYSGRNLKCRGVVSFNGSKNNVDIGVMIAGVYSYVSYKKPNEESYLVLPYYYEGVNRKHLVGFLDSWNSFEVYYFLREQAINHILSNF